MEVRIQLGDVADVDAAVSVFERSNRARRQGVLPNRAARVEQVSYLFIVPERWGEGIGGAILDAVLAEAKRRDYSRIHLWTHDDNERSHRLYRSRASRQQAEPRVVRASGRAISSTSDARVLVTTHASVPLRRVGTGELRWERFLYHFKAGLRVASGRPRPARPCPRSGIAEQAHCQMLQRPQPPAWP